MTRNFTILLLTLLLAACQGGSGQHPTAQPDSGSHAQLLTMEQCQGYMLVTIANPWKQGQALHTYVLVPRDSVVPANLPQGTVVRTPIARALVYSEVHTSLMAELDARQALRGVCDAQYFSSPWVKAGLQSGEIADCGNSQSPSIERVMAMRPDAILLSPYQDVSYGQLEGLDIPIVECADYMETSPLGRAQWMRFYGALLGRQSQADSLLAAVAQRYNAIKAQAATAQTRPTVITESEMSGTWNVPGGRSYMARVMADAGGAYPWAGNTDAGSVPLTFDQVLAKAQHADCWLLKGINIHSLADLKAQNELNTHFDAFKNKKVWVCNSMENGFYNDVPFHPDLLLGEFAAVLHPELFPDAKLHYYQPLR